MTALALYQVDAFTNKTFGGNPAAVVPLQEWLPDEVMQNIAIENNLSETAFFIPTERGYHLRWFTPTYEIDLCGHATLGTSHVILHELHPNKDRVVFETNVSGDLIVTKSNDSLQMDFPSLPPEQLALNDIPNAVLEGLHHPNILDAHIGKNKKLILTLENEKAIKALKPNFSILLDYPSSVIVTAPSDNKKYDFVSRYFCAYDFSIQEDPVTGSAHCMLVPYWAKKLGKSTLAAYQASKRGGELFCELKGDRVFIKGQTKLYLKGEIYV
jgi:PhzF family phenazine biosynthesis protein